MITRWVSVALQFIHSYLGSPLTTEGRLEREIEEQIEDMLMFSGVRVGVFNNSVNRLVTTGSISFVVAMLIFVVIVEVFDGLIRFPDWVGILALVIVGGAFLIFSFCFVISGFILIFYIAALARFAVKRARRSLQPEARFSSRQLEYAVFSDTGSLKKRVSIYESNVAAFTRSFIYVFAGLFAVSSYLVFPYIRWFMIQLIASLRTENLPGSYIRGMSILLDTIDAVILVNLAYLIEVIDRTNLTITICFIMGFLIFLNVKHILQLKERASITEDLDQFSFLNEFRRYIVLVQVTLHYLHEGRFKDDFQQLRGELWNTVINTIVILTATYFVSLVALTV